MLMNNVLTTLAIFKDHLKWPENYCVAEVQEGGGVHLLDLTEPEDDRVPQPIIFTIDGEEIAGLPMLDDKKLVGRSVRREIFEAAIDATHFDHDNNLYYHDTDSVWYRLDTYSGRWDIIDRTEVPALFQLQMNREALENVRNYMQYDFITQVR